MRVFSRLLAPNIRVHLQEEREHRRYTEQLSTGTIAAPASGRPLALNIRVHLQEEGEQVPSSSALAPSLHQPQDSMEA